MNPLTSSSSVDHSSDKNLSEFPTAPEQSNVRPVGLEEDTPIANTARKVPFPTYQDWISKFLVDGEKSEEFNEKVPEDFKEDVELASRTFTWDQTFEIMNRTVCFNVSTGQLHLRLVGAYRLEKAIYELGLTLVKVPKQILWVYKNEKGFLFAQKIISRTAKITAEEVRQIKALIDHTGFSDYKRDSLIASESGIYFVDLGDQFDNRQFDYLDFLRQTSLKENPGFDENALMLMNNA